MSCDIIIVKYGLPELEAECVASLEKTTGVDFTVTEHDNYEADEYLSKVWNDLIRASDSEYICLLNNDTRIEEGDWLAKLLECFDGSKVGAVGPMTNHASGFQGREKGRTSHKNLRRIKKRGTLVGFCMVFPKCVWEEAGGFDEEYAIYGEDSDFCMTLGTLGYELIIRTDVFVFHHGRSSAPIAEARGKDLPKLIAESRVRYREKWMKK